ESVTFSCPVVRVRVPVKPGWNTMTSGPAWLLAARIAWRKLPKPASLRFLTVMVDGTVRSSSGSRAGRHVRLDSGTGRQREVNLLARRRNERTGENHIVVAPSRKQSAVDLW